MVWDFCKRVTENFLYCVLTNYIRIFIIKKDVTIWRMIMDIDLLYMNIKEYCAQMGISISQLEKGLHFGTGTIGKSKR